MTIGQRVIDVHALEDRGHFLELKSHQPTGLVLLNFGCILILIRNDVPVLWDESSKLPGGLQVWLVEARKDEASIVDLELRVKILLVVNFVGEGVQALAVTSVQVVDLHLHNVGALLQVLWREVDHVLRVDRLLLVSVFVLNQVGIDRESGDL